MRSQRPTLNFAVLLFIVFIIVGCAGTGGAAGSGPRKQRNVITAGEIATLEVRDAYEVVQRLRPQMLRVRGSIGIAVYVNGIRMSNGLQSLTNIAPASIREIRYLNSFDATARFGTDVPDGAISVTMK
tara:strand:- start:152 stop:535 length:384 start_codon:yes stop_codon:yes gene_type:complete